MPKIIFEVPEKTARQLGPMRHDLEINGQRIVVHLCRHPSGVAWAGDPCLMVSALPAEIGEDFFPAPSLKGEEWAAMIPLSPILASVKAAMDVMERLSSTRDEWEALYLAACEALGFDPEWRPAAAAA